jgi:hypothetical protein
MKRGYQMTPEQEQLLKTLINAVANAVNRLTDVIDNLAKTLVKLEEKRTNK